MSQNAQMDHEVEICHKSKGSIQKTLIVKEKIATITIIIFNKEGKLTNYNNHVGKQPGISIPGIHFNLKHGISQYNKSEQSHQNHVDIANNNYHLFPVWLQKQKYQRQSHLQTLTRLCG